MKGNPIMQMRMHVEGSRPSDSPRAPGGARARAAMKSLVRQVNTSTSQFRPLPDFLIIGAKRGGTTSFYFDLLAHPNVIRLSPRPIPLLKPDATKGAHYFDSNFRRGDAWYRSYMPTRATRTMHAWRHGRYPVVGEASPYYLFHPAAAERAHRCVPSARIIVLLRDPVMRTYSHWKERRRAGAEPLDFVDALAAEPGRLAGERSRLCADQSYTSYAWEQQSYLTQSLYAEALRPWVELFGRHRVLALASEDYYRDPAHAMHRVDDFLGLPRRNHSTGVLRNAASGARLPKHLQRNLADRFSAPNHQLTELLEQEFPWA